MRIIAVPIALLALLGLPAFALAQTTHIVNQSSLSFSPDDITIEVGDTVRWVYGGGSHTVTNGTGTGDPDVGNLFDAPLNGSNTSFEFTFTTAGDVPYFCRPHVNFGMTGIVRVTEVSAARDVPVAAVTLSAPMPNPFNPRAEIRFALAEAGLVDVEVFDARGRRVTSLLSGQHRAHRRTAALVVGELEIEVALVTQIDRHIRPQRA